MAQKGSIRVEGTVSGSEALAELRAFIDSLSGESPSEELKGAALALYPEHQKTNQNGKGVYDTNYQRRKAFLIGVQFGRRQVLQEIYEGKIKPFDSIIAGWIEEEEDEK